MLLWRRLCTCTCLFLWTSLAVMLVGQQPSDRDIALELDKQILHLGNIPVSSRTQVIKHLASKILQLPGKYAVPLASNLAVDGTGDTNHEGLQVITETLREALRRLPPKDQESGSAGFEQLAELVLYAHTDGSLDDSRYRIAVANLKADDQHRSLSDFRLPDLQGHEWSLTSLRVELCS